VATSAFRPCYLGGWTACEHWGLTEQLFRSVVVITGKRVRNRAAEIQGTRFLVKVLPNDKLFGTKPVWRGQNQVQVSDPSRTIVDILDDPTIGGGIRHVADILSAYCTEKLRNDSELLDYTERLGNRTVFKRLGFLLEARGIPAPELIQSCLGRKSAGLTVLDPTVKKVGRVLKRWNLRVNVEIKPAETRV
jgi:predicted transcriptional regulator of viral defense system